jgi:hypothetical protein
MEKKETLFIAFSTQKGGVGKTTLTVLTASYLHYVKGLSLYIKPGSEKNVHKPKYWRIFVALKLS